MEAFPLGRPSLARGKQNISVQIRSSSPKLPQRFKPCPGIFEISLINGVSALCGIDAEVGRSKLRMADLRKLSGNVCNLLRSLQYHDMIVFKIDAFAAHDHMAERICSLIEIQVTVGKRPLDSVPCFVSSSDQIMMVA